MHAALLAWSTFAALIPPTIPPMVGFDGQPPPPIVYRGGVTMCEISFVTRAFADGSTATIEADPCWYCLYPMVCPPPDDVLDAIPPLLE